MSEEKYADVRTGLTLQLLGNDEPFKLTEQERFFGPDDWAWLFLNMNTEYIDAYKAQCANGITDTNIKDFFAEKVTSKVFADRDGSCQARFGLAAWLSPWETHLPTLKNGGSWFFPLNRLILEDGERQEVDQEPFIRRPGFRFGLDSIYLVPEETLFGYLPTRTSSQPHWYRFKPSWSNTCVAIDCSIPPDGQVSALRSLVKSNRKHLQNAKFKTYDKLNLRPIVNVKESNTFAHMTFKTSRGKTDECTDPSELWFAICIDVLAPIESQIEHYLDSLGKKHRDLVRAGLAKPSVANRYASNLPSSKMQHGGSRLKALHILAELRDYSEKEIVEIVLGIKPGACHYSHPWHRPFIEKISDYLNEAKALTDAGYAWLVHTQTKPDAGKAKK